MPHPYGRMALGRGARAFLTGKLLSAGLTFAALLALVRLMDVGDYAAYVTLMAALELGVAFSGLGLPWLAARFVPEYRLRGGGAALARFVAGWILVAGGLMAGTAALVAWGGAAYASWTRLGVAPAVVTLASALLFVEGMGRYLRDCLLEPLLQQAAARASLVTRQGLLVAGIAWLALQGPGPISVLQVLLL